MANNIKKISTTLKTEFIVLHLAPSDNWYAYYDGNTGIYYETSGNGALGSKTLTHLKLPSNNGTIQAITSGKYYVDTGSGGSIKTYSAGATIISGGVTIHALVMYIGT